VIIHDTHFAICANHGKRGGGKERKREREREREREAVVSERLTYWDSPNLDCTCGGQLGIVDRSGQSKVSCRHMDQGSLMHTFRANYRSCQHYMLIIPPFEPLYYQSCNGEEYEDRNTLTNTTCSYKVVSWCDTTNTIRWRPSFIALTTKCRIAGTMTTTDRGWNCAWCTITHWTNTDDHICIILRNDSEERVISEMLLCCYLRRIPY
jgi:hypothetical protein